MNVLMITPTHFILNVRKGKSRAKVHVKGGSGIASLSIAIEKFYEEVAEISFDGGAELNEKSNAESTPRHYACNGIEEELARKLIKLGANLEYADSEIMTPFNKVVCSENSGMLRIMIEGGTTVDVCLEGKVGMVKIPLQLAISPAAISITPYIVAGRKRHEKLLKVLIGAGAKVDEEIRHEKLLKVLIGAGAKVDEEICTLNLLQEACKKGDISNSKMLLDAGANIDERSSRYTKNPLQWACRVGNLDLARFLLQNGANVNIQHENETGTPLHSTDKPNQLVMMKLFVEFGADVNAVQRGYNEDTPLHKQCAAGHADMVKLLLQSGAKVELSNRNGDLPLHIADGSGRDEIVGLLLARSTLVNTKNCLGRTPLHRHCQSGNVGTVELLLAAGANVHEKDCNLMTPLHHACDVCWFSNVDDDVQKRLETIKIILKSGASTNDQDDRNRTPMDLVCDYPHASLIEVLLQWGVNVNEKLGRSKKTPLHYVIGRINHSNLEGLTVLLNYGADMEETNDEGFRPIHIAMDRDLKAVKHLLDHGANIDGTDKESKTILHYACDERSDPKLITLLLEWGANPNKPDQKGKTPLHYARTKLYRGDDLVKTLLNYGADVNSQDKSGNTALHYVTYEEQEYYFDNEDDFPHEYEQHDQIGVLKILVDAGANVNLKNASMKVPFQVHINTENMSYNLKTVRLLLEAGTNLSALNIDGKFLNSLDEQDLVALILDYGAGDLMCRCKSCPDNTTVLMCAFNQLKFDSYKRQNHCRHIIKVEAVELNKPTVNLLSPQDRLDNSSFRRSCEEEVALMKNECIGDDGDSDFTYYDLLRCENSSALLDEKLPWSLTSNTCRQKFLIYGDMMYSRFAPVRKNLLLHNCSSFTALMTDLPMLPPECVISILEKLSYSDLSNVAEVWDTFHQQSDPNENTVQSQL